MKEGVFPGKKGRKKSELGGKKGKKRHMVWTMTKKQKKKNKGKKSCSRTREGKTRPNGPWKVGKKEGFKKKVKPKKGRITLQIKRKGR